MYKTLALTFLAFIALGNTSSLGNPDGLKLEERQVRMFESVINQTLNTIIAGLPETIKIDKLSIQLPGGPLDGNGTIDNLTFNGVKGIVASKIALSIIPPKLNMTILVPSILLHSDYWADMLFLELVPFYGDGNINMNTEDIVIDVFGAVDLSGGITNIILKNVTFMMHMGECTVDVHGLMNNAELSAVVSAVLTQNVAKFINDNDKLISSIVSPLAQAIINSLLHPNKTSEIYDEFEAINDEYRRSLLDVKLYE